MFRHAIVRRPGATFAQGLTRVELGPPRLERALEQHRAYCDALRRCGLELTVLPPDEAFPDGTFVEDTAILLREGAMLTRPGAASRIGEVAAIRAALTPHYAAPAQIDDPGSVDGGDICEAGKQVFIGLSHRTNAAGAEQLARWLHGHGYAATTVDVRGLDSILHLKSGLSFLGGRRLLLIEELAAHPAFASFDRVVVERDEAYAANAIEVNGRIVVAAGHPRLEARLRALGCELLVLDMSEFAKMDGGLSCLSLRFY
ncbi:MAG: arginine deiminase family protein [Chiayiivirga sp.]|jgi:dimethylargininase|uniref:dimethylarginine dimethylaminohydrolase family protein n=1 Tax=Chiayiivirga sp. TaxID=2041042 RepID=UPI0025BCFFA4|nr:arginine deiminase family protein [Chiayiivirga sp.]MCI1711583.1 arginine deiminase family protein [Chiayiivirga sp.]MCI1730606.1 arginine deiminase family protein [Chiayiivirga sp.]